MEQMNQRIAFCVEQKSLIAQAMLCRLLDISIVEFSNYATFRFKGDDQWRRTLAARIETDRHVKKLILVGGAMASAFVLEYFPLRTHSRLGACDTFGVADKRFLCLPAFESPWYDSETNYAAAKQAIHEITYGS